MSHGRRWVLAICLAGALVGCAEEIPLPEAIAGRYTTAAPKYADRYFVLKPDRIELGLGGDERESYRIKSVERRGDDGRTLYTVTYGTPEGDDRLQFYLAEEPAGAIVLKSQPAVTWVRRERGA